jgi:sirohydrochlorin cobaltochelatase
LKTPAILLITHGSRESFANRQFHYLSRRYAKYHPNWIIKSAFLENANPSIFEGLKNLSSRSDEIDILPLFLFAAQHLKKDIPEILDQFRSRYPKVVLHLGKELGPDPSLALIALQRIKPQSNHPGSTVVLFLGRGARDPEAVGEFQKQVENFSKLCRFKKVLPCYFEIIQPSLEKGLEEAGRFNPKRIVVLPYLLFNGSWRNEVKKKLDDFRHQHPAVDVELSQPLGFHSSLMKLLDERWQAIPRG